MRENKNSYSRTKRVQPRIVRRDLLGKLYGVFGATEMERKLPLGEKGVLDVSTGTVADAS